MSRDEWISPKCVWCPRCGGGRRAVGRAARPARARRRVAGAAPPRAALRHQARERAERARAQARELHLSFYTK